MTECEQCSQATEKKPGSRTNFILGAEKKDVDLNLSFYIPW